MGRGVLSPVGEESGERAVPLPRNIFAISRCIGTFCGISDEYTIEESF